jgi:hypothetical protein
MRAEVIQLGDGGREDEVRHVAEMEEVGLTGGLEDDKALADNEVLGRRGKLTLVVAHS